MRSDDRSGVCLVLLLTLAACSSNKAPAPAPAPVATVARAPETRAPAPTTRSVAPAGLPEPAAVRNRDELRRQAANRLVAANPDRSYTSRVPEPLLAAPVLQVELHADGSIRRIEVLREPHQAKDTIQLAKDALHRAAPFGNLSRMPPPWTFIETFLFDDQRRFKPRTLD